MACFTSSAEAQGRTSTSILVLFFVTNLPASLLTFRRVASVSADVGANGSEQLLRRSKARSLALVNRSHDRHSPLRQDAERRLRLRVGKERRVQGWTHDYRRAPPDRLGHHRERKAV